MTERNQSDDYLLSGTGTQLEKVIASLEAQREILGDAVVDAMIAAVRKELRASAPELAMEGERKLVTVMFADISGFTALADAMDPEAVRDLMNACFEQLVPVVEKYEGTVDKFIGDEIMALFGAPAAHENDPERALRAALEMMEALAAFNAERGTELGLHFGVNTGLVIAGGLGTRQRQEYSVMGDAVNLAARLEDASERGEILVGPATYRLTAPVFEFEALEPMRVKGKAEPVAVHRLLAVRAVAGKARGIVGLESPLVGREAEFRALQEAVERLQVGLGGIVTLVGEAGLGKSRLAAELRSQVLGPTSEVIQNRELEWVEGRCLSYATSIAYLPWLDVLRVLLRVTTETAPAAVRAELRKQVESLCPGQAAAVYLYLARLMSLQLADEDEDALRDLEGEQLRAGAFRAVESLLEGAAWRRPLVIVCEDLHWADPTSIELLEYLLPLTDRAPLLFLCVFRPETGHGSWRVKETAARHFRHRHIDLWLDPLSPAESEALVSNLLSVEALPPDLRDRILSHAEGNPFYVEEIIRSLVDSGVIARDEASGRWEATRDVADIAIPDTLHGVLVARIDRLQEETKRVLQLAAVVGQVFLYRVLAEIAREERQVGAHLLTLQREEMIRERARLPELEYIFKHHLTQEAAYNGLLRKERRRYHRQVAEALERLFPERVEEQAGLLAHHWERTGDAEKATECLLRAGDQARLAYAHQEAIDYYQRALAYLKERGDYERAARTLMKLGLTFHTAFEFRQARQAYQEGFALWGQASETWSPILSPAPHALRDDWLNPRTLDPALANDTTSAGMVEQLFSGLVELKPDRSVVPDVARSWEVSGGGRKYVFHLRDDVRWSDGTSLTASDFEYAWKRVLNPTIGSPAAGFLYDVKGARAFHQGESGKEDVEVQALDDLTLAVELEGPTGYFLHLLTNTATYPVPRHVVEAHGEGWADMGNIVTNGPFRLDAWRSGQSMVFSRNQEYHGRFGGNVERVELDLSLDPSARLEMYEADDFDVFDLVSLPPLEMDGALKRHVGDYVSVPTPATQYVGFNVRRPPFDDHRVRRAFVLATDREALADDALRGTAFPATGGFVPPEMLGHSAGIGLPCDPDQARRLLAEAGYPGGLGFPDVHALVWHHRRGAEAEYLQVQWHKNLGVEITWERAEASFDRLDSDAPDLFFMGWRADYPDPDNFLRVAVNTGRRYTGWRNEAYDRLVEEARRVMDQVERMKLYTQADRILVEEAAIIPLTYIHAHILVKPWVRKPPGAAFGEWCWKDIVIEPH